MLFHKLLLLLGVVLCHITFAELITPLSVSLQSRLLRVGTVTPKSFHSPPSPYNTYKHINKDLLSHIQTKHKLSMPDVDSETGVEWDEYDLTSITLTYSSPLHLDTQQQQQQQRQHSHSHVYTYQDAFQLQCPDGRVLSLNDGFPTSVWSGRNNNNNQDGNTVADDSNDIDEDLNSLYMTLHPLNIHKNTLQSFNLFASGNHMTPLVKYARASIPHSSSSSSTWEMMIIHKHTKFIENDNNSQSGSQSDTRTRVLTRTSSVSADDLLSCKIQYIPVQQRNHANNNSNENTVSDEGSVNNGKGKGKGSVVVGSAISIDRGIDAMIKSRYEAHFPPMPLHTTPTSTSTPTSTPTSSPLVELSSIPISLHIDDNNNNNNINDNDRFTNGKEDVTPNTTPHIHTQLLPPSIRTIMRPSSSAQSKAYAYSRLKSALVLGDGLGSAIDDVSTANPDLTVLLQTDVSVGEGGMVARMVEPVVGGLAKPVLDLTSGLIMDMFASHFIKKLYGTIITEVSPDVGMMLGNTLKTRLSNTLVDSITYSISNSLNPNLVRVIAPIVSARVQEYVPRRVPPMLDRLLFEKISRNVAEHLPLITARALTLSVAHGLTRSITQALVPALTHTISHHTNSDYYCLHCFQTANSQSCSLCHFSDSTVYYQLYYAAYYADYYSKYYTTYYVNSIRRVDEIQHKTYNSPGSTLLPQTKKYIDDIGRALDD